MERRFNAALEPENRRRFALLLAAFAATTCANQIVQTLAGISDTHTLPASAIRMLELALLAGTGLLAWRMHGFRQLEVIAFGFGVLHMALRCLILSTIPSTGAGAMVIGTITLLYFGLPLRGFLLAPLMAAGSGAMVAAWALQGPGLADLTRLCVWVWIINIAGLTGVRMARILLRRQWAQSQALRHMAMHDALTSVANRRHYDQMLNREWFRSAAKSAPISVVTLDVDYFKLLNDRLGHAAGDACLRDVAALLEECATEPGTLVARTGGEEFALLLPGMPEPDATAIAARIAEQFERAGIAHPCSPLGPNITVSIGVATARPAEGGSASALASLADRLVYDAKRGGRNCIRQATLPPGGEPSLFTTPVPAMSPGRLDLRVAARR